MKKILVILLMLAILCLFSGCVIIPKEKNFVYDAGSVASIEIFDLSDTDGHFSETVETAEPYYTLDESEHEGFLSDLAEIQYKDHIMIVFAAVDPSFVYDDWSVKIKFNDGSYRLQSCDGYGEDFDSDGKKIGSDHYSCDNDEWYSLIEKYLPDEETTTT